jgi:hypothetical protein
VDLPFAVLRERSPNRETVEYPDASHFLREDAGEG